MPKTIAMTQENCKANQNETKGIGKYLYTIIYIAVVVLLFIIWLGLEPALYNYVATGRMEWIYKLLDDNWKLNLFLCIVIILGCALLIVKTISSDSFFHVRVLSVNLFLFLVLEIPSRYQYVSIIKGFDYKEFLEAILIVPFIIVSGNLLLRRFRNNSLGEYVIDDNNKKFIFVVAPLLVFLLLVATLYHGSYTTFLTATTTIATVSMVFIQSALMIRQQIDHTYYLIVGQWREIAKNIEFGQNWFHGRSVFKELCDKLQQRYLIEYDKLTNESSERARKEKAAKVSFEDLKNDKEELSLLDSYFQYFKHIITFLDRRSLLISKEKKIEFVKLLKPPSIYERCIILFYMELDTNENSVIDENTRNRIIEYGILKDFKETVNNDDDTIIGVSVLKLKNETGKQ